MDILQAIQMLKDWNEDLSKMEDEKEGIECHNMAIKALERQVPKKPVKIQTSKNRFYYACPTCEERQFSQENHCRECGQSIDWRAEK